MKEEILKILEEHNRDMSQDHWYGKQMGIREDDFEDVADKIIQLLEHKPDV